VWASASTLLPSAAGASAYVLGDSIGEGVADASGLHKLAHISVHIRGPKAIAQINATPAGSVAFIVLGTNDADGDGNIKTLDKSIDEVVQAGERRKLKMIWIGPPCVRRSFDVRAREVDRMLRDRLAGTPVQYVGMRDERLCSGVFHEPDGVHLTMKGYHYMWDKVRSAVSWSGTAVANAPQAATPTSTRTDAGDATGSILPHVPNGSSNTAQDGMPRIRQMFVEVHTPARGSNSAIVWTAAPD
jgi:hypothetical protein